MGRALRHRARTLLASGLAARLLRELSSELVRELLDGLYPRRCPVCAEPPAGASEQACAAHALDGVETAPSCDRCARALPPVLPDGTRCAECVRRPPGFERLVVLGEYRGEDALREWVLALKYRRRTDLAPALAARLARRLDARREGASERRGIEVFVPVPLHPLRRLERGYDQAACLARALADVRGARFVRALRRTRWTPPQGALGAVSRSANVYGAFASARERRDLFGAAVWLVDDVVTSGATVEACASVLRGMGARRVRVCALARAGARSPDRPESTRGG